MRISCAWRWDDGNAFHIRVEGALPRITTTINGTPIATLDAESLPQSEFDAEATLELFDTRGHIVFEVHDNDPRMARTAGGPALPAAGAISRSASSELLVPA